MLWYCQIKILMVKRFQNGDDDNDKNLHSASRPKSLKVCSKQTTKMLTFELLFTYDSIRLTSSF